jgi:hypothetical protein
MLCKIPQVREGSIFEDRLSSRVFESQAMEMFVKCAALIELRSAKGVRRINLCKPDSYDVMD